MKNIFLLLIGVVLLINLISAACDLNVVLVNQDPYPAMPGDYVKVVFQVSGLQSPDCGTVEFELKNEFPFSLDPGAENKVVMKSGTYTQDYKNFFLVPYKLRVDKDALNGENKITVTYSFKGKDKQIFVSKDFNITVEDSRTDFEINIKDYSSQTKKVTFEILNIGKNNIEGLTIDIPKQENIKIYGTNRVIIGDLNSNEEDSATFDADLQKGDIKLELSYTDQIGIRRKLERTVNFDPDYFQEIQEEKKPISSTIAFIVGLLIPIIFFLIRGKLRKRKERLRKHGAIRF